MADERDHLTWRHLRAAVRPDRSFVHGATEAPPVGLFGKARDFAGAPSHELLERGVLGRGVILALPAKRLPDTDENVMIDWDAALAQAMQSAASA